MRGGPEDWQLLASMGLFALAMALLVWRASSLYFGLTMLCLYSVSSASLAGYIHSVMFGLPLHWVTPSHITALNYSIIGCLAMVAGIAVAWRADFRRGAPNRGSRGRTKVLDRAHWINPTFGWVLLGIGIVCTLGESAFHRVATIGSAIHALASFATFGILVLLADSLKRGHFAQLALAGAVYAPAVLLQAFASGHTPLKVSLLLPAVCVFAGIRQMSAKAMVVVAVCGVLFLSVMTGWLNARKTIRTGQLTGYGFVEKVQRFIPEWYEATSEGFLNAEATNRAIRERVDMTDILAMQVRHQPARQPYANGQTVMDAGVALVPRILWPRKPVIAGGSAFVSKYTGMVRDPRDATSIGLPYQFELYANGGPVCVVVGLFLIGYVCGWLERGLFAPPSSLGSLLARISITMTLCEGGQRTDVVLPALIAGGVTYFAFGKLLEQAMPRFARKMLGESARPPSLVNRPNIPARAALR